MGDDNGQFFLSGMKSTWQFTVCQFCGNSYETMKGHTCPGNYYYTTTGGTEINT